jgi:hypothetical protein
MYNCDVIITYKQTEEKFLSDKEVNNDSDDVNDVYFLCEEIYRIELLKIFNLTEFNTDIINNNVHHVFTQCVKYTRFKELLDVLNTCNSDDLEVVFMQLFSYDLLYISHSCIAQLLTQNKIDEYKIENLENLVKTIRD